MTNCVKLCFYFKHYCFSVKYASTNYLREMLLNMIMDLPSDQISTSQINHILHHGPFLVDGSTFTFTHLSLVNMPSLPSSHLLLWPGPGAINNAFVPHSPVYQHIWLSHFPVNLFFKLIRAFNLAACGVSICAPMGDTSEQLPARSKVSHFIDYIILEWVGGLQLCPAKVIVARVLFSIKTEYLQYILMPYKLPV